jgi:hypothetical protein
MKTQEEIERLAAREYWNSNTESRSFIKGYTQCQEDMADYIFEVARQFHRLGKYSGHISDTHFTDIYEETINSLNKQD